MAPPSLLPCFLPSFLPSSWYKLVYRLDGKSGHALSWEGQLANKKVEWAEDLKWAAVSRAAEVTKALGNAIHSPYKSSRFLLDFEMMAGSLFRHCSH